VQWSVDVKVGVMGLTLVAPLNSLRSSSLACTYKLLPSKSTEFRTFYRPSFGLVRL